MVPAPDQLPTAERGATPAGGAHCVHLSTTAWHGISAFRSQPAGVDVRSFFPAVSLLRTVRVPTAERPKPVAG